MSAESLVTQLRFARSEFQRCLAGVSAEDGVRRLEPMNCISWIVGHMANQEHAYWVVWGQGQIVAPGLYELVGFGQPPSTPPLDEMWATWHKVTAAADPFLDALTPQQLDTILEWEGKPMREPVGTLLLRNIYQYWQPQLAERSCQSYSVRRQPSQHSRLQASLLHPAAR
jgi:hypothetical protein